MVWPERVAGVLIGLLLTATAVPHILAPFRFLDSLLAYRMVSGWSAEAAATVLPWFQLVVGIVLTGCRRHDAAWMSAGLLFGLFLAAQLSAVARGLQIDCGCFPGRPHPVSARSCAVLLGLMVISFAGLGLSLSNGSGTVGLDDSRSREAGDSSQKAGGMNGVLGRSRRGWTLVELIAVIGIIGTLLAFLIPAVQSVRESARQLACLNQLRQLGQACLNFESARRRLPAGTLGFPGTVTFDSPGGLEWSDSSSPGYWKNVQHTSALVHLLPYTEALNIADGLPGVLLDEQSTWANFRSHDPMAPEWIGDLAAVQETSRLALPMLHCPSDDLEYAVGTGSLAFIATQPAVYSSDGVDWFLTESAAGQLVQPAGTNYRANAGAHGAGWDQDYLPAGYAGPFLSRPGLSTAVFQDGLSHTVLFGESNGVIEDRRRTGFHAWMWGGLARGRGGLPWMRDIDLLAPQYLLFGDDHWSHPAGFGSMHPQLVNFVLADGSTHAVSRLISLQAFYSLCGSDDGSTGEIERP